MPDIPVPDVAGWPQLGAFVAVLAYLAWKAWLDSGRAKDTNAKVSTLEATSDKTLAVEGVQFHPESILTQYGHDLLANFLGLPRRKLAA